MQRVVVLIGAALLWIGCKGEPLPDGDAHGFETAFNEGDAATIAGMYTEDAVLMPPGTPAVVGRDAIQKEFTEGFENKLVLKADYNETGSAGDLGYKSGTYTMNDVNGLQIDQGKFLEVWKREQDGWKMYRDAYNSDSPPPPSPLTDADKSSIQATLQSIAEAFQDGDLATWGAQYAEDAVMMPAGAPPATGRAAILDWAKAVPKVLSLSFEDVEIRGEGGIAVATSIVMTTLSSEGTEGEAADAVLEAQPGEGAETGSPKPQPPSKQLVVLEKQADGTWLITLAMWNGNGTPEEPATEPAD